MITSLNQFIIIKRCNFLKSRFRKYGCLFYENKKDGFENNDEKGYPFSDRLFNIGLKGLFLSNMIIVRKYIPFSEIMSYLVVNEERNVNKSFWRNGIIMYENCNKHPKNLNVIKTYDCVRILNLKNRQDLGKCNSRRKKRFQLFFFIGKFSFIFHISQPTQFPFKPISLAITHR